MNTISVPARKAEAARQIAIAIARSGNVTCAKAKLSQIDCSFDRGLALLDIAALVAASGSLEEAYADLDTALTLVSAEHLMSSSSIYSLPRALGRAVAAITKEGRYEAFDVVKRFSLGDADLDSMHQTEAQLTIARCLGAALDWKTAKRFIEWVIQPELVPELIELFLINASSDRAKKINVQFFETDAVSLMQTAVGRIQELPSDARLLASRELAPSVARVGDWDSALGLASFHVRGFDPADEPGQQQAAAGLASAAAMDGDLDRVRQVVEASPSEPIKDSALKAAAEVFARMGNCDSCEMVLRWIRAPRVLLDATKASSLALVRSGNPERALDLFVDCCSIGADSLGDYNIVKETIEGSLEIIAAYGGGDTLVDVLASVRCAERFFSPQSID